MKIFFTSSIRGLKSFKDNLDCIYNNIKDLGHNYIGNYPFKVTTEEVYIDNPDKNMKLFNDMENFMKECDLMILEVSKHSVSMGYMIMKVLSMKKPVIALYTQKNNPAFLVGIEDENFQLIEYEPNSLKKTLEKAIENASDVGDIRFNMMFSPKLSTYLKEASETESVSKATFIRRLIKEHKNKNHTQ
jgi:hypothetical protein